MRIVKATFSPTGGTARVAAILADAMEGEQVEVDLSDASFDGGACPVGEDDLVIVSMPSFAGRAPEAAVERLGSMKGNGARCVLVCVYGNRAYEDTLVEMQDAAEGCGLKPVAAVAAIAQHSIIERYAAGRPDILDEEALRGFARRIVESTELVGPLPGNRPYKKGGGAQLVPKPGRACVACGLCQRRCPVAAITEGSFEADSKRCIDCMRCLRECPSQARSVNGLMVALAAKAIKGACSQRKECELFL